ncbi:MAG TPA: PQQ-binding-like beta-propeller repeat protein [Acidimicrobiales bacterium]|nr:PQQ-binding-like beta-propeller repeat protein [Acidimicrobiales bacterium]
MNPTLRRRRTVAAGLAVVAVVIVVVTVATGGFSSSSPSSARGAASTTTSPAARGPAAATGSADRPGAQRGAGRRGSGLPDSAEAGIEPWSLPAPVSREAIVADGSSLLVLGGLSSSGTSASAVAVVDPQAGSTSTVGSLAAPVHDAAAATEGGSVSLFGGGSPATVDTVQGFPLPGAGGAAPQKGTVAGRLPEPRSDLAAVTVGERGAGRPVAAQKAAVTYLVGGYDGQTTYLPDVLATSDGTHFSKVAALPVPVRYPALASVGGLVYAFGGQVRSSGSTTVLTDDIQVVDPVHHRARVVGHLPRPVFGAAAFALGGTVYVAGGETDGAVTLTAIEAFVPRSGRVLDAGLLPQADAFAGTATLQTSHGPVGYLVGGEVANQSGPDQAGVATGTLSSVMWLRPSSFGGPAGRPGAGSPFSGTLLIADRGNNRLLALDPQRRTVWQYPSPSMPPPPGGFYFPDDAFFIRGGTGIISNQEDNHTLVQIGYPSGRILWQYGHAGQPGAAPGYLDQPDDAYLLRSGVVTVADASNNRILFISPQGQVVGQIGNGRDAHDPPTSIGYPNGDTPLADGDVLVSEITGSWVDELTPAGRVVWSLHLPSVDYPSDPQQIGSDLYLMCDYDPPAEGRILEFTSAGAIPWRYDATGGDAMLKKPSLAERLPNGLVMVNDDYRDRVVAIDPATDSIVWQYGLTDVSGTAPGVLSIPDGFDLLEPGGVTPTHPATG